jgi:hypothetical protein
LEYFQGFEKDRPVGVKLGTYSYEELSRVYSDIQDSLEPAGVALTESWDYLKQVLDEDRSSPRKLFP